MIDKIAGALPSTAATPSSGASFQKALQGTGATGGRATTARPTARPKAQGIETASDGPSKVLSEVQRAQARLDSLLKMAESGRTFSPAELLAFQTHAYRASQELDLAGKVVEKGTSAVKQTLQTQL